MATEHTHSEAGEAGAVCGPNNPNFSQRMPTPPCIQASTVVLLLYYVYYFYRHDSD